ncbi:MAG: c-type cytochrome [Calditrichota bacterium]
MKAKRVLNRGGVLQWVLLIVAGLAAVILLVIGGLYIISGKKLNQKYDIAAVKSPVIQADSVTLARGQHVAYALGGCVDCHGEHYEGKVVADDPMFARLYGPNLTSGKGGLPEDYSYADFERAVRHGVGTDGTSLWIMPSYHYCNFSDNDLAALYAYIRNLPPVDATVPKRSLGPIGRMLYLQKKLALTTAALTDHHAAHDAPPAGPTAEYGHYMAKVSCVGCHGQNLSGGPIIDAPPEWPPAANLTRGGIGATYTEDDFFRAMREGKRPGGATLSEVMPYRLVKYMTDDELHALWAYLQTCPPALMGSGSWMAQK